MSNTPETVMNTDTTTSLPSREELNAELLEVPEPPEQPELPPPPGFEDSLEVALRHVKGRRGGDLVGVLLVGSGARRSVTPHSDIDVMRSVTATEGKVALPVIDYPCSCFWVRDTSLEEIIPL